MYETYWQLSQKPFENVTDARFYYPSESHQAALLKLRYAIENRRGAALLAGPSGCGKTLLTTMLLIVIVSAFTAELVTLTATESLVAKRRHDSLAHTLAVDSLIVVLESRLSRESPNWRRKCWKR